MCKKDLKEFDIVRLRNGDVLIVLRNNVANEGLATFGNELFSCHSFLESYRGDLTHVTNSNYDIVAVDRYDESFNSIHLLLYEFFDKDYSKKKYVEYSRVWDWKREEVKELTVDEISNLLGYKVKVIDDEH